MIVFSPPLFGSRFTATGALRNGVLGDQLQQLRHQFPRSGRLFPGQMDRTRKMPEAIDGSLEANPAQSPVMMGGRFAA